MATRLFTQFGGWRGRKEDSAVVAVIGKIVCDSGSVKWNRGHLSSQFFGWNLLRKTRVPEVCVRVPPQPQVEKIYNIIA